MVHRPKLFTQPLWSCIHVCAHQTAPFCTHDARNNSLRIENKGALRLRVAAEIKKLNPDIDCDSPIEDVCKTGDALNDPAKPTGCGNDHLRSLKCATTRSLTESPRS